MQLAHGGGDVLSEIVGNEGRVNLGCVTRLAESTLRVVETVYSLVMYGCLQVGQKC